MITMQGKGVFGAVAVGKIRYIDKREIEIIGEHIHDTEAEMMRFAAAKEAVTEELDMLYQRALTEVGEDGAQIFDIHKMMLEDEDYNASVADMIKIQCYNAEYAVSVTRERFSAVFASMDDEYMQARAADVQDISRRLIDHLLGIAERGELDGEKVIICADDLTPSETLNLDRDKVLAFVTRFGSGNSHTAILARSMNIPAIVGVIGLQKSMNGKWAAVNGFDGMCYIEPDEETMKMIEGIAEAERQRRSLLEVLKGKENITLDGTKIEIYANIGGIQDVDEVQNNDADGIGLFRSEFLYLGRDDFPDEETQFRAYKKVLSRMEGKRVIVRTMDIGADKQIGYFGLPKEENPALGFRAIRICLAQPEIFRTQLRALLRASVYGKLGIMFPMIISLDEILSIQAILQEIRAELDREGIAYSDSVEYGIMIETPAAAILSDVLAPHVDFFSVGTNDLTQYTLALDRQNPRLEHYGATCHEAVFRLIRHAVEAAHRHRKWIGICGELGADLSLTEQWLRMGIDELSVAPPFVLAVRDRVRKTDLRK